MAEIPQVIPRGTQTSVASYDYTDIASGLGFVTYYPCATLSGTGTLAYFLVTTTDVRPDQDAGGASTTNSTVSSLSINFDTSTFNLPRTAKGTAFVNFAVRNPDADVTNCKFSAQLKKVASDGTTLTNLSSAVERNYGSGGGGALGATTTQQIFFSLALTQTQIKVGEKLRLTIILTLDDASDNIVMYHDPAGRDLSIGALYSTQAKVHMPFRVDTT